MVHSHFRITFIVEDRAVDGGNEAQVTFLPLRCSNSSINEEEVLELVRSEMKRITYLASNSVSNPIPFQEIGL